MRFLPKIVQDLFGVPRVPPSQDGGARAPIEDRIARLATQLGDRMVAAEAETIAVAKARVEPLFADFARQIEDRPDAR